MKMLIHAMQQMTPEWYQAKCGKISASSIADVLAKGQGKTRKAYMMRILAERISGLPQETYSNGAMLWGIENEPLARQAYESKTLNIVDQVGFIEVDEFLGCSPDGLIGDDGGVEIKCPYTSTHLQYILDGVLPSEYRCQVQSTLWMTKRQWWDFVSFDPRIPDKSRLFCIRVERDEKKIEEIALEVHLFIQDLLKLESQIKGE
jgi:putative phage-type endonuclease